MAENFTFDIDEELFSGFEENHNARDEYEASEEYNTDIQTENARKEYAPIATKETAKIANDDDSGIYGSVMNFGKHVGIGGAKGVEEAGQFVRALDDNAWNLPQPKTTSETIAQGLGQFLPIFVGTSLAITAAGAGAVAAGVVGTARLANVFSKSRKLRVAKDFLIGTTAGAVSDIASFDPKDPNVANFLLTTGAISQDPRAAAALKVLAQNDADSETTARLKSAATGAIAGALTAGILKGAGYVIKKGKGKGTIDGVPIEEIEQGAKTEAESYVESVIKVKQEAKPEQMRLFDDLPDLKAAAKDSYERETDSYIRPWERLTDEQRADAEDIVAGWSQGGKVSDIDLSKIESMNLLKIKGSDDIKPLMQFLSQRMDIKKLLKGRIKTADMDTESGMADLLEIPRREAARIIEEQGDSVRDAIRYVGVARALGSAEMKKADDAFALYASNGDRTLYEKALDHTILSYDMLASGGEFSKAASDLLRSHQKLVNNVDSMTDLKTMVRHSIIYSDPELSVKQAGWFTSLRNVDELKITSKYKGGATRTSKIPKIKDETPEQTLKRATEAAELAEENIIQNARKRQLKSRLNNMNKSFLAKTRDTLLEVYVNGLLSSVKTFEVNAIGNSSAIVSSIIDRAYAGVIKRGGDVTAREAAELGWGYLSTLKDFGTLMKQSWDLEATANIKQDFIRPHDRSISKETWQQSGVLGKAIDYFGNVVNFPGRILLSADEVFKTFNYRAETRALAYRKAVNDSTISGDKLAINNKFAEIMQNVETYDDIVEGAKGFAAKNTFTNKLSSHVVKDPITGKDKVVAGLGLKLKGLLDSDPSGIARTFIPFFQTPANLLNFAWERTPLLRRLNKGLKERLSPDAPKAVRELAEAQVATSRVLWGSTMALAFSGNFTGGPPRDPNLRKTLEADMGGSHWYSYRSDNGWVKYDRMDPLGVILSASAHAAVMGKAAWNLKGQYEKGDPSDEIFEKYKEVLEAGAVGMARLITDRHYLQGFSEMLNIISSEGNLAYKAKRVGATAASVINPAQGFYSSFRRNIETGLRPQKQMRLQGTDLKDLNDLAEEIGNVFEEGMRKQVFGYGERTAMKNLAGEPVLFPGINHEADREPFQIMANIGKAVFDPIPALQPSKSPLIKKLAELESTTEQPSSINKLNGIVLTDEEKSYFIDQWTDLNKSLNKLAASTKFNKFPQGTQRLLLENLISRNKKIANKATLIKYKRLLEGTFNLKRYDLQSKFLKDVPTGFNQFNLGQQ
jgi:hypothetical protein